MEMVLFGLHDEVFQNTGKVKKLTCVSIFALLSSSSEVSTGATLTLTFTSWSSPGGSECLLGDGVVASLPDNQNARSSWKMEHSQSLVRYLFVWMLFNVNNYGHAETVSKLFIGSLDLSS